MVFCYIDEILMHSMHFERALIQNSMKNLKPAADVGKIFLSGT
jgi:hypothetical protein